MNELSLTEIIETLAVLSEDLQTDAGADWATESERVRSTIDASLAQQAVAILRQLRDRHPNNISS